MYKKEMAEPLYCEDNGHPSIDPVALFKTVLIQHLYSLPTLRQRQTEKHTARSLPRYWQMIPDIHKNLYKKRKESIERLFADAKEKHAVRYTQYRSLVQATNRVKLDRHFHPLALSRSPLNMPEPRSLPNARPGFSTYCLRAASVGRRPLDSM